MSAKKASNRRDQPSGWDTETVLLFVGVGLLFGSGFLVWAATVLGHMWARLKGPRPGGPLDALMGTVSGKYAWPVQSTIALVAMLAVLAGLVVAVLIVRGKASRHRSRVDDVATYLGRGEEIAPLRQKAVKGSAERLGVDALGVPIGQAVFSGEPLFASWEDMHLDIWGPRTGKTTSRAVPAILAAPGGCLVTSNKRDVVDATRGVREKTGPVFVFDPQGIAAQSPTTWWNPLSYVTDEVKAANMAEHFASGSREAGARTDAYFDGAGQNLLAGLLLAAALDKQPITQVYRWLTRPNDDTPVEILQAHGFDLTADEVAGVISAPEKQRGGVYGTAQQMASCLTNRQVLRWVTPQGEDDDRPQFDPHEFVRGHGTLYSLSKEGKGTAGPLVTALTVATVEAAEELASRSPGGRLSIPMLGVLDEAANVCRWRTLPDLYSHYGSRGIVLMTILQSWSQGVDVWGESGMNKLWSASNIVVYGGGVKEHRFLESLSELLGTYDKKTASTSYSKGSRSYSQQLSRERIMEVADLQALPRGRAIVFASGARPTLIKTQPWYTGPQAEQVKASLRRYDPGAEPAIQAAERDYQDAEANAQQWTRDHKEHA